MTAPRHPVSSPPAARQRGQAFIVTVLLLIGMGTVVFVYGFNPAKATLDADAKTVAALVQAKDALIGYAVGQPNVGSYRPGELPCPDLTDSGTDSGNCNTPVSRIGRLPWKTLGLPDLRDGSGERLWYAVSNVFKNAMQTGILNSETPGDYTVTGLTPANSVIAIIFAPGGVRGSQNRSSATTALCATTATTIAMNLCATNYLEGVNADGTGNFITALPSDTFNDKLMLITSDNFFPAVEQRVLTELRAALRAYRTVNGYFPSASTYASTACDYLTTQGRVPLSIAATCPAFANWGADPPPWFAPNNWQDVTYYAVSACRVGAVGGPIGTDLGLLCGGVDLTVAGTANVHAAVFTAGRGLLAQVRPCANVSNCLEDGENTNGDKTFVKPVLSAANNDRLSIVWP